MTDLGPCGVGVCTSNAVAYVSRTLGPSARLTVVTGPRAAELLDHPITGRYDAAVCHEHAAAVLDDLLLSGGGFPPVSTTTEGDHP